MIIKNKARIIAILLFTLILSFSSTAMAFQDIKGDPGEREINRLKESHMINGINGQLFDPQGTLTYAEAVQMIVKGFDLNIDHLRFFKEPKASDYYLHVEDDAWYAHAFMIAQYHELGIAQDVQPHMNVTKEIYADLLYRALESKGPFPMIRIYIPIMDNTEIAPERMGSIQALLIFKITELNEEGNFNPHNVMTRSEAAIWLYNALEFVEQKKKQNLEEENKESEENMPTGVNLDIEFVNEDIQKAILSWGEKPNGCYSLSIRRIEFTAEQQAIIYYKLHAPGPNVDCIQVITYPTASAYIDRQYEVIIKEIKEEATSGIHLKPLPIRPIAPTEQ